MYKLITKAIEHFRFPISHNLIQEALMAHPLYPTLSSISDTFDLLGIEHLIAKISLDDIKRLGIPILSSLTRNEPILIIKITDNYVYFRDIRYRLKKFDKQSFLKSWLGVSILIQNVDKLKENNTIAKDIRTRIENIFTITTLIVLMIGIIIICSISWRLDEWLTISKKILLLFNNIIGVVICALLYMNKNHSSSNLLNKLCAKGKYTDCNKVVNSIEGKSILSNYIVEIAAGYFTCAVVWLIFSSSSAHWEFPLSVFFIASIPIIFLSLYLQLFYVKKICVLCCTVLLCLLINIFIIKVDYGCHFLSLLKYLCLFLSLTFIYVILSKTYGYKSKYYHLRRSNARIKFDINTIHAHLSPVRLRTPDHCIHWGNSNLNKELTIIVSIGCKHCRKLIRELMWLKNIYKDIHYKIIFDVPYEEEDKLKYINYLYYLNEHNDSQLNTILNEDDYSNRQRNTGDIPNFDMNRCFLEGQHNFVENAKITYVPSILINGRQLSSLYNVQDIISIVQLLSKV